MYADSQTDTYIDHLQGIIVAFNIYNNIINISNINEAFDYVLSYFFHFIFLINYLSLLFNLLSSTQI